MTFTTCTVSKPPLWGTPVIESRPAKPKGRVGEMALKFQAATNTPQKQVVQSNRPRRHDGVMQRVSDMMELTAFQHFQATLNKVASGAPAPVKPRVQVVKKATEPAEVIPPRHHGIGQAIAPGIIPPPPPLPQPEPRIAREPKQWGSITPASEQALRDERDTRRVMAKPNMPSGIDNQKMGDLMGDLMAKLQQRAQRFA